jgi:hypothetical protein
MYMKCNLRAKFFGFITAVCLFMVLGFVSAAVDVGQWSTTEDVETAILGELNNTAGATVIITGTNNTLGGGGDIRIHPTANNQKIIWEAETADSNILLQGDYTNATPLSFEMRGNASVTNLNIDPSVNQGPHNITVGGNTVIIGQITLYTGITVNLADSVQILDGITESGGTIIRISATPAPVTPLAEPEEPESPPTPPPLPGEILKILRPQPGDRPGQDPGEIIVKVIDNKHILEDDNVYYGTVEIENLFSDTPKAIPDEVFINGVRYRVRDSIYIVGERNLTIIGYTETGVSYVFTAVENTDDAVKFTAEGLPEGVLLSENGVLSTEFLPLAAGTFEFTVTVDNGKDTHSIPVTLIIKEGYGNDRELLEDISAHDKEPAPQVLDGNGETDGILNLWINGILKLHYDPELEDFAGLFLDGKLLEAGVDYLTEEGSTVVVLTEQTMVPLTNGDHVVNAMFRQNSDVGLDTVINDVGSSSFVFRFGEKGSSGIRLNISGGGVEGSVTFDGSDEEPLTTLSANTEAIKTRCANLSNATGNEIIAAFETKQSGGFGGKTATFAVSAKSLGLTLKDETAVYIAVYDSKTGKTYQNAGTVKDGMIIFKTKYSGVFMISKEKF